ncbi:MAG: hypothetical protein Q4G26_10925 [Paracoccus sp. (in: a-proteobacteria)]|nr:hypothetical protein [Paracoccus sp. (in: a-proteobacteria)]
MSRIVAALSMGEPVSVDEGRLQDIVNELGERAAEGLIQLALEQMALGVHSLRGAVRQGDAPAIVAQAERLSRLAWQIGLVTLAGVAVDIAACARCGDPVALDAVMARLVRVADRSLLDIWDSLRDG